jgi:glycerol uptake facilitator-like aquaporin
VPLIARRVFAEFLGTALLLIVVVGSGIAAQRLSPNDVGLQLLENALATGAGLTAIILAVGSVSGAHLNPVVSVVDAAFGGLRWREVAAYIPAQVVGAVAGVVVANAMFALPGVTISTHNRSSGSLWLSETIATLGLLLVIFGTVRSARVVATPFAVGAYIAGAYFFTSSTSFANPAVTVGREFSNTFAGISPGSVAPFIAAQAGGAVLGWLAIRTLYPTMSRAADAVMLPHQPPGDNNRAESA